jgi:hypothetical protein
MDKTLAGCCGGLVPGAGPGTTHGRKSGLAVMVTEKSSLVAAVPTNP